MTHIAPYPIGQEMVSGSPCGYYCLMIMEGRHLDLRQASKMRVQEASNLAELDAVQTATFTRELFLSGPAVHFATLFTLASRH